MIFFGSNHEYGIPHQPTTPSIPKMKPHMSKKKYKLEIEFETDQDWNPMIEAACWCDCPLACLTKLGETCHARKVYDKDGLAICPVFRYGREVK